MPENKGEGISRRDLLRKGAVLGGAVVWATPVVQTLSMGRAYAQIASPTGDKDISYIGINVTNCADGTADFFVKWEEDGVPDWEEYPGAAPSCANKEDLADGVPSGGNGFVVTPGPNPSCKNLFVPTIYEGCTVVVWVKAAGTCNTFTNSDLTFGGLTEICSATP